MPLSPMKTLTLLLVAGTLLAQPAPPLTFDMKDPKGVSGLSLKIDSLLEPVRGHANGVSGSIVFDPAKPEKSTGKIVIDASSVTLGSADMTGAMHGDWCLEVAKYPTMTFVVTKIDRVKKTGEGQWNARVSGDFTIKDVTRSLTANASVSYLPNMIKKRGGLRRDGDLLKIVSKFSIKRSDYKVSPDLSTDLIGDTIEIDLATIGVAPK